MARTNILKTRRTTQAPKGSGSVKKHRKTSIMTEATKQKLQELYTKNQTSPLLRLPAELRHIIYKYALGGHTIIPFVPNPGSHTSIISMQAMSHTFGSSMPTPTIFHSLFALSLVCRQLRAETLHLPYKLNVIKAHDYCLPAFLARLKPVYKAQITTVWLGMEMYFADCRRLLGQLDKCEGLTTVVTDSFYTDRMEGEEVRKVVQIVEERGLKLVVEKF